MPTTIGRKTVDEYFETEFASDGYYEYINGQTIEMDWETVLHNEIVQNLFIAVFARFKDPECRVCSRRTRLKVAEPIGYLHPDVCLARAPQSYEPDRRDTMLNPFMVFEVMSESTESNDRGCKFNLYRNIDSLQYYVLISHDEVLVESFSRQPNGQLLGERFVGLDAVVPFEALNWKLRLSELYRDIE